MPIDVTSRRKTRELEESLSQTRERGKKTLAEIRNDILEIKERWEKTLGEIRNDILEIKKQQEEIGKELEELERHFLRTI